MREERERKRVGKVRGGNLWERGSKGISRRERGRGRTRVEREREEIKRRD